MSPSLHQQQSQASIPTVSLLQVSHAMSKEKGTTIVQHSSKTNEERSPSGPCQDRLFIDFVSIWAPPGTLFSIMFAYFGFNFSPNKSAWIVTKHISRQNSVNRQKNTFCRIHPKYSIGVTSRLTGAMLIWFEHITSWTTASRQFPPGANENK